MLLQTLQDQKCLFDKGYRKNSSTLIVGVDEAGRGPLAGPVVAAALVITHFEDLPLIDDSKKLSSKKRQAIAEALHSSKRVHIGIGIISETVIDEINIFQATLLAMQEAINDLDITPDTALIDGSFCPKLPMKSYAIVKGDSHSLSIGAASIIAKETRDHIMLDLDEKWPQYGFKQHKGYGTTMHLEKIKQYGPCPCHRRSFSPIKQLSIGNY